MHTCIQAVPCMQEIGQFRDKQRSVCIPASKLYLGQRNYVHLRINKVALHRCVYLYPSCILFTEELELVHLGINKVALHWCVYLHLSCTLFPCWTEELGPSRNKQGCPILVCIPTSKLYLVPQLYRGTTSISGQTRLPYTGVHTYVQAVVPSSPVVETN